MVAFLPEDRRRYVGRPRPRVEARDIVTGRATYAADVRLPGMLHGAIVRPPVRGANVKSVDTAAARAMPGVVAVVHDGDVVGVVAKRASQARAAADAVGVRNGSRAKPDEGPDADIRCTWISEIERSRPLRAATRYVSVHCQRAVGRASRSPLYCRWGDDLARPTARSAYATAWPSGSASPERVRCAPRMSSGTYGRTLVASRSKRQSCRKARSGSCTCSGPAGVRLLAESPEVTLEVSAGLDAGLMVAGVRRAHREPPPPAGSIDPGPPAGRRAGASPYRIPTSTSSSHGADAAAHREFPLARGENMFAISRSWTAAHTLANRSRSGCVMWTTRLR
jgi:hypothetical protein